MKKPQWLKLYQDSRGMTLIEIMVVIAIIGMVMAAVTVSVVNYLAEARVETTRITIGKIENALMHFKRKHAFYPSTEQGLDALVEAPSVGRQVKNYPADGYLEKIPLDAWDNEFDYYVPGRNGTRYEVVSRGDDGEPDTEDDISSANDE